MVAPGRVERVLAPGDAVRKRLDRRLDGRAGRTVAVVGNGDGRALS
jgi:hypothetical protein